MSELLLYMAALGAISVAGVFVCWLLWRSRLWLMRILVLISSDNPKDPR